MVLTVIAVMVALLQLAYFGIEVGRARGRFNVPAPAMSGHPEFDRYFRVQMNTVEQIVMIVPSAFAFAYLISDLWAAVLVAVYIVGRIVYFRSYVVDPSKRGAGFGLSFLPGMILMIGSIIGAVMALL